MASTIGAGEMRRKIAGDRKICIYQCFHHKYSAAAATVFGEQSTLSFRCAQSDEFLLPVAGLMIFDDDTVLLVRVNWNGTTIWPNSFA